MQQMYASAVFASHSGVCADCQGGGPQNSKKPVTFAVGSTKNAIKHLKKVHRITAEGPIAEGPSQQQQTIEATFGKLTPSITFNDDVFRHLLWRYIYTTNESFRVCEEESFRILLGYLAACVSACRRSGPFPLSRRPPLFPDVLPSSPATVPWSPASVFCI
jgi:hypothetical protein